MRTADEDLIRTLNKLAGNIPADELPEIITCDKCGYTRQIRKTPRVFEDSIPGTDPGCPNCH